MKPIFNSKEQEQAIASSIGKFKAICFLLSTASSAYCLYAAGGAMLPDFLNSIWVHIALGIAALYVCYLIDFFGVSRFGAHVAGEIVAVCSREFYTPTMKKLFTLFSFLMFAACFLISFYTSRDGSKLVAALAKNETNVDKTISMIEQVEKKKEQSLASYKVKIQKLEEEAEKAVKTAANAEIRRLAAEGNSWAIGEEKAAKERVAASYDKKIKAVKDEMNSLEAAENKTAAVKLKAIESDADTKINAQQSKSNALLVLLQLLGVWPLFIATILMALDAIYRVQKQIPYSARQQQQMGWVERFKAFTQGK